MKNRKIFILLSIIFVFIFIVLFILGNKTRVGYLGEIKFDEYHINKTLELNSFDIEETKKLFMINGELDNESLTNYIFTNELITNYSYGFRLKYYSKIFRNSDIYGVYPDINKFIKENSFIKEIKMDDNKGTPFGNLISSIKIDSDKIYNISYYLRLKENIAYIFIISLLSIIIIYIFKDNVKIILSLISTIILISLLFNIYVNIILIIIIVGIYLINQFLIYKRNLDNEENKFINIIFITTIFLYAFHYWLCYPGYFQIFDYWLSILSGLYNDHSISINNWHPVLLNLYVNILIVKLGFNISILFIINLFLWYSSLFLIVSSIYIKTKNKLSILIFAISFLSQIFFFNIFSLKDSMATLYVFFSYSIIFFIIMIPINKKNRNILKLISLASLILGMLHRHNFIVTVYPIFIWFTYDFMKNKNIKSIKKYILSFITIMLINSIILMGIYFIFPRLFIKNPNETSPASYCFLLQIAGCVVPANDAYLIPNYLYNKDKTFNDVVKQYNKNSVYGDPFAGILDTSSPNIKKIWINAIIKYPINYLKHLLNFSKYIFAQKYVEGGYRPSSDYIQKEFEYPFKNENYDDIINKNSSTSEYYDVKKLLLKYGGKDRNLSIFEHYIPLMPKITFNKLREKVYSFTHNYLININIFFFIFSSVVIFFITLIYIIKNRYINDMLILSFSISFSALATTIIVILFSPIPSYRYIYPVIPISIISFISFVSFIYKKIKSKNIE